MSSVMKSTRGSRSDGVSIYSEKNDSWLHREPDIIWPEWSDVEINAEKWGAPLKYVGGTRSTKESKGKISARLDNAAKLPENELFEDPYPVEIAYSLHKGNRIYWQRPNEVYPAGKMVIHADSAPTCPDLITSNRRLLRSEFIRSFISSIQILTYIGYQHPFEIEWQSLQFTPNTRNLPWEPWHHIYSIGRAGGSSVHNPICNMTGKYAVRLYWLGCWRKILVDDRFPVNATGKPLLPTSTVESNNEIELWPLLLTKALMKIASLSWTDQLELVDFDIIACLTGWAVQKLNIKGLDLADKWEICSSYSDHFTWDKKYLKEDETLKTPDEKKAAKDSRKVKSPKSATVAPAENAIDFHLVGTFADLRNYSDLLEDITPCWSHEVLLEATRCIPLVKQISDITDELAAWKEFRWIDWAIEHGLWEAEFTLENKQFIKIVSSLRKVIGNNTIDLETSYREKCIKNSVDSYAKFFEEKTSGKSGKKPATATSQKDKPKKSPKTPKVPKVEKFIDPSIWCYFNRIADYIQALSIYIKPSSFSSRYVLTNFKLSGAPPMKKSARPEKKGKDEDMYKHILWDNALQYNRNDTMYLFTDSIDFRLTIFTLSHIGKDFPECQKETNEPSTIPAECTKEVCVAGDCIDDCKCQKKESVESLEGNFIDRRRTASIVIEDYDWKCRQTGDMSMFLKTYGTSSLFFNFAKGRHVKRLWMNAEPALCLHVFSDDPYIKIGKCDEILERMAMESELLTKKSFDICAAFGNLVQTFATPDYPRALRNFYKSYLPENVKLSKKNAARLHDCFAHELNVLLADTYPDLFHYDMSRAIRVIFLDPNFRIPYKLDIDIIIRQESVVKVNNSCPCIDEKNVITDKDREKAAIKIQSYFKMDYMLRLKAIHNYENKWVARIVDCIKSIYMDIFSSRNRDLQCMRLVRAFLYNPDIKDLVPNYYFWNDMKTVIDLKIFTGDVTEVKQVSFLPLFKRTFFCIDDEVYMRPYIYSTIGYYILRVFDNDTAEEIERYTNNTLVYRYVKNKKGYTILAYGYSSLSIHPKLHNWKLLIACEKVFINSAIDIDQQPNSTVVLDGFYIPNLNNLVCKIKVKVNQNCHGTYHLQSSSPSARMKMEVVTPEGAVIAEAYGMSSIMLPFVNLIIDNDYPPPHEMSIVEKNNNNNNNNYKPAKKIKSQRRVSSKSLTLKDRKKIEKESAISIATSVISKKKGLSFDRSSMEYKDFYVRIYVLENSWPLTINEWTTVKLVRENANVEPELFPIKPTITKTSVGTRKFFLRHTPRRGSKSKDSSITKPFWIFTSYNDGPPKQMNISLDLSRQEEIRDIKKQIILDDPERYFMGKEKRQEFLERSYIQWTPESTPSLQSTSANSLLAYLENAAKQAETPVETMTALLEEKKSVCRTCQQELDPSKFEYLKAPDSVHRMLPPFEYNKQYEKMYDEERWPIEGKREQEILDGIQDSIETFEQTNESNRESVERVIHETKRNYKILNEWYKGIREQSNDMMTKNDNKREYVKEKLKELKSGKEIAAKDANKKKRK